MKIETWSTFSSAPHHYHRFEHLPVNTGMKFAYFTLSFAGEIPPAVQPAYIGGTHG